MPTSPFPAPPLLSVRQAQLVKVVEAMTDQHGYAPSLREVALEMGVSFGRVAQLVRSTAAKGAMTYAPGIARSLRVVQADRPRR
jgi:SOS-response transcriptional repressor LexA